MVNIRENENYDVIDALENIWNACLFAIRILFIRRKDNCGDDEVLFYSKINEKSTSRGGFEILMNIWKTHGSRPSELRPNFVRS